MIIPLPANIYWVPTLKEALVSMLEIHLWIGMGKEKTYRQTNKKKPILMKFISQEEVTDKK